ncbi:hypothetical protein SedNR2807_23720 [Citrobacter sedlakii]
MPSGTALAVKKSLILHWYPGRAGQGSFVYFFYIRNSIGIIFILGIPVYDRSGLFIKIPQN